MIPLLVVVVAILVGILGDHHPAAVVFGVSGGIIVALTALHSKQSSLDASWWAVLWVIVWTTVSIVMQFENLIHNGLVLLTLPGLLMVFPIYTTLISLPAIGIIWSIQVRRNKKQAFPIDHSNLLSSKGAL